jgi:hypothetical protein
MSAVAWPWVTSALAAPVARHTQRTRATFCSHPTEQKMILLVLAPGAASAAAANGTETLWYRPQEGRRRLQLVLVMNL